MDMKRLEIFCKVVELKSFTRTAEAIHLSQPTVSENIRQLEESLGEKLLDRLGREVLPTPAGRILFEYALRIIQLGNEARQAIAHHRGQLAGTLALGASTIPGAYILPRFVESFKARCGAAQLTLKIAGSAQIVQELLNGGLEMAVVGAVRQDPRLESTSLFADELVLTVPPDHPWSGRPFVRASDLEGEPFVLREEGSGTRLVTFQVLRDHGCDPERLSPVAEMGSNEAVREAVKARLGISILSARAVAEDLERGTLAAVPIEGVRFSRSFYLVRRKKRELTPLAQAFLEHLERSE